MRSWKVYSDGGARGNPGLGAIAVVITDEKNNLQKTYAEKIGFVTNNLAEYKAFLKGVEIVSNLLKEAFGNFEILFYSDSELLVSQLNGKYKVKNKGLLPLFEEAKRRLANLKAPYRILHLGREKNTLADRLLNEALDRAKEENP